MWDLNKIKSISRIFVIGIFILLIQSNSYAQEREYLIKSAFIEKITRFIKWPDQDAENKSNIIFGVMTEDTEVFETVQFYFKDQLIQNKKVEVIWLQDSIKVNDFDLIFIAKDAKEKYEELLKNKTGLRILTITDDYKIKKTDAHINLTTINNRLSFHINPNKLNDGGFYVSSKLYAYGEVIKQK